MELYAFVLNNQYVFVVSYHCLFVYCVLQPADYLALIKHCIAFPCIVRHVDLRSSLSNNVGMVFLIDMLHQMRNLCLFYPQYTSLTSCSKVLCFQLTLMAAQIISYSRTIYAYFSSQQISSVLYFD